MPTTARPDIATAARWKALSEATDVAWKRYDGLFAFATRYARPEKINEALKAGTALKAIPPNIWQELFSARLDCELVSETMAEFEARTKQRKEPSRWR